MRISDWSSDVCSSDLREVEAGHARLQVDPPDLAVAALQLPALAHFVLAHCQRDVVPQLVGIGRQAGPVAVAGTGHHQLLVLATHALSTAASVFSLRSHCVGHVATFVSYLPHSFVYIASYL